MTQPPAPDRRHTAALLGGLAAALGLLAMSVFGFVIRPTFEEPFDPLWKQALYLGSGVLMLFASWLALRSVRPRTGRVDIHTEAEQRAMARRIWISLLLATVPGIAGFALYGLRGAGMDAVPLTGCGLLVVVGVVLPSSAAYWRSVVAAR